MCILNENETFFDVATVEIVIDYDFSFSHVSILSRPPGTWRTGWIHGRGTVPAPFQPTPPVYACVGLGEPCLFFWTAVTTRRCSDRSASRRAKKARWLIDRSRGSDFSYLAPSVPPRCRLRRTSWCLPLSLPPFNAASCFLARP